MVSLEHVLLEIIYLVQVLLKEMSDGEVYVTCVVEGDVCVEQTEGEKKHMCV